MKYIEAKRLNRLLIFIFLFVLGSSLHANVTVNGNTISWPDNGWYQVQTEDGSETLCNGGSSCTVDPGLYLVINHSTGERFKDIKVGGNNQGNIINTANYQAILEQMVLRLYAGFYDPAFDRMEFDNGATLTSESSNGIKVERSYACNDGGTYETVEEIGGAAASNTISLKNCLTDGVTYNGDFSSGQTFGRFISRKWENYEAIRSGSDQVRISYEQFNGFNTAVSTNRYTVSEYEFVTNDNQDKISNMETSVSFDSQALAITSVFNITVRNGLSNNGLFTLSTLRNFTDFARTSDSQIPTYTMGQLEIVAEDQSRLMIDANNGDPDTFTALVESPNAVNSYTVPWSTQNILPCFSASECKIER